MRRTGLQAELLWSLVLVVAAATAVWSVVLYLHEEGRLRDLLARGLLAEARSLPGAAGSLLPGTLWWRVRSDGSPERVGATALGIDPETHRLAERARELAAPLVQPGAPWDPIRFAAPLPDGSVLVARLPEHASWRLRAAPLLILVGVLLANLAVFAAFGMSLLRRRVVLPLQRLAAAARSIADGAFEARVPVEGPRESAEVAEAFNEMTEALERRTGALEKAVVDLRDANRTLRETREGLERTQRLAAVGRLAAGVAHEVGNPIGAMLALLDLVRRDGSLGPTGREHLGRALEQGERVRNILRQLLEFSRPPQTVRVPLPLVRLAQEAVALVAAQDRYRCVRFEVDCADALPEAVGDPAAVAQILLNLVLNAADAVQEAEEPEVRVVLRPAVRSLRAGEDPGAAAARQQPDALECVVADNGCGISPEDRERLFDPFFTTKPPGEGTGLGLANSARLAEELGGTLELVPPPPGMVTAFSLRLPVSRPDAGALRSSAGACGVRSALRGTGAGNAPEPDAKPQG